MEMAVRAITIRIIPEKTKSTANNKKTIESGFISNSMFEL
jgi:hypothetical protein